MLFASGQVAAEPARWHLELGGAHPIIDPQDREYGPGTEGQVAAELALARAFGIQLEGGSLWLAHTNPPMDPSIANHGDGSAVFAMGGARLRPLTDVAGPWADANLGYVRTGGLDRFGFDAHVGYDWRVGQDRWDIGPYVGYFQIVQPQDSLRPEDAHVLSVGIHVALGTARTPPPAPPSQPLSAAEPAPAPPPPDRDFDGIPDPQDACPDAAGVPSSDPALNGCPPKLDTVRVVDDHIEYGEVILFGTDRAEVQEGAQPVLRKLAEVIEKNPQIEEVEITGHADERGSEDYNLRLSHMRADSVRTILVGFGVEPSRLVTKGLGFRLPRAQGHTEQDWRQNRRVEFRISKFRNPQPSSAGPTLGKPGAQP